MLPVLVFHYSEEVVLIKSELLWGGVLSRKAGNIHSLASDDPD